MIAPIPAIQQDTVELYADHLSGIKTQKRGHLLARLIELDDKYSGRWEYWAKLRITEELPPEPIPEIHFGAWGQGAKKALKVWETSLGALSQRGGWRGWDSWQNLNYFLDWLLWGFGHPSHTEPPVEPRGYEGAGERLLNTFDLEPLIMAPCDHLGDMMAESRMGRHNGFYPTPHEICEMMTRFLVGDEDLRAKTACDCCCGTGRLLLHMSNHCLRLYGQDIDLTVCKVTLVNGYLFAPWLVKPLAFLDSQTALLAMAPRHAEELGAENLSETLSQVAQTPQQQMTLFDTVFDAEGTKQTAPILKRRKVAASAVASASIVEQMKLEI